MSPETKNKLIKKWEEMFDLLGLDYQNDPNLQDTPKRIVNFWQEFLFYKDDNIGTVFPSIQTDQLVVVKNIPFSSLCAHHLLAFVGHVSFAYLTTDKQIGLSKIPRIVRKCASRLQSQEQLAHDIADMFSQYVDTESIAVIITGEHSCMRMRGVRSEGEMVTSVMRGQFREDESLKNEFLRLSGF